MRSVLLACLAVVGFILFSSALFAVVFDDTIARDRLAHTKLILTCQMKGASQNVTVRNVDEFMVQGDNLVAFFDEGQQVIHRPDTLSCVINRVP